MKYKKSNLCYFKKQGLENVDTVIVGQPKSFAAVDSIIKNIFRIGIV